MDWVSAVPSSWQESSGWCSIYVQINHPATVGPSADEWCISCIDTYLYSTVFHPQQEGYTLLRNPGAFIGQAASPLRSCCVPSSLQVSLLVAAAENEPLSFHLPYWIWFRDGVSVHCPLFRDEFNAIS